MDQDMDLDLGLGLEGTHVVVTGGAGQIGEWIVKAFLSAGAYVSGIDIDESRMTLQHERLMWVTADVTNEEKLEQAFAQAATKFGMVSTCCAAAGLDLSFITHHASLCDLPLDQWQRTMNVNLTGTFLTARAWLRGIRDQPEATKCNVNLIVIGSEAGVFGVPGNADYSASKAGIQYGLVRSTAPEAAMICRTARVNAIAPGPVDTPQFRRECSEDSGVKYQESEATVALKKSVPMIAVAKACVMLASDNYSGSTTGQILPVDSGKSGRLMWQPNGARGW